MAKRVFVISRGLGEHLSSKHQIETQWLPVPMPRGVAEFQAYRPGSPDLRMISFLGAVNALYLQALQELLVAIRNWNQSTASYKLGLRVMTYTDPNYVTSQLGSGAELEVLFRRSTEECRRLMRESWALFLPYSFQAAVRFMVNTSFPSKLAESIWMGRPLLVYGPASASLPRYFLENQLPICITDSAQLHMGLQSIEHHDQVETIQKYAAVAQRLHAPTQLASLLSQRTRTPQT